MGTAVNVSRCLLTKNCTSPMHMSSIDRHRILAHTLSAFAHNTIRFVLAIVAGVLLQSLHCKRVHTLRFPWSIKKRTEFCRYRFRWRSTSATTLCIAGIRCVHPTAGISELQEESCERSANVLKKEASKRAVSTSVGISTII